MKLSDDSCPSKHGSFYGDKMEIEKDEDLDEFGGEELNIKNKDQLDGKKD